MTFREEDWRGVIVLEALKSRVTMQGKQLIEPVKFATVWLCPYLSFFVT